MKKWILPFGSLTAIAVGVIVALAVAGVFDGDDASGSRAQGESDGNTDTAGLCIEGATDCDDTIEDGDVGDGPAAACLENEPACNDTPDISQICAEGVEDCDDLIDAPPPDEPVTDNPVLPVDSGCEDLRACEERVIEVTLADLEQKLGADAETIVVEGAEYQEWSNSCLDAAGADELCAEVITPGFVVVFQANGHGYEYHTDLTGNNIRLAE